MDSPFPQGTKTKALAGLRVLEYAGMVAGPYCGKLLADLGAEVIKVEDAGGGDLARYRGPFVAALPHPERSVLFQYLNTSKSGITLDLTGAAGLDKLGRLAEGADVFISDKTPRTRMTMGLSFEALQQANPGLIITSVTPFGETGPYAEYKAYPLSVAHSSLLAYLTPGCSPFPEREPLKLGGMVSEFSCGLSAAVGTLAAVYTQRATGLGQLVDVSKQEAMLDLARVYASQFANYGITASRLHNLGGMSTFISCRDGFVVLSLHELHHWQALVGLMGNPDWALDKRLENVAERNARFEAEIKPRIAVWAKDRTMEDLYHQGQAANCPITPVMSAQDVVNSEQSKARGFFVDMPHPLGGSIRYPGAPYKFSRTPWALERPAPFFGHHNDAIGFRRGSTRKGKLPAMPADAVSKIGPSLKGIRVVDFAWAWAGPHAAATLGKLGAEVIKVESNTRIDHSRILSLTTGQVFGEVNRSPVFSDLNINKRSITLNLRHPRGIELAKALVRISDVVVQNMRPGVMDRLGLSYEALQAVNPEVIMLSLSALGMIGPHRHYIGYAPAFGALGGLSHISGYPDSTPALLLGEADLLSGTTGVFALMAALAYRQQTGVGQHIDLSSAEAISALIGDVLMDYSLNGNIQFRQGNRDESMAPHNCYRCRGEDKWISIAIATDEEWRAFCMVTDHREWIIDPRFADARSRWQNQEELDKMVASWTVNHTHYEAMEMLQRCGVAAIPSFNGEELANNPHLRQRKCWVEVEHPLIGKHTVVAPPWKLSRTPAQITRHGPLLGEHNQYVFGELLGLSNSELDQLIEEKILY